VRKNKFHHFWPPLEKIWKNPLVPPLEKILPTPIDVHKTLYPFYPLVYTGWTSILNLLSEMFSTLRLSEMLLLFINCLISIFLSTFYQGCGVGGEIYDSDLSKISDSDSRLRLLNIKGMKFGC